MQTFINDTLGLQIDYMDHRGNVWRGMITSPDLKIVEQGQTDYYNFVIEFDGELQ